MKVSLLIITSKGSLQDVARYGGLQVDGQDLRQWRDVSIQVWANA